MSAKMAPLPGFVLDKIHALTGGKAKWEPLFFDGEIPEGSRNDALFRHGAELRAKGATMRGIRKALHSLNAEHCNPPLGRAEVDNIVDSVDRYARGATATEEFKMQAPGASSGEMFAYSPPFSAASLHATKPAPVDWIVDGLLPVGLGMLAGDPKVRKSFLAQDLGFAVSTGNPFLGHKTVQAGVLYLALEDSANRLYGRGEVIARSYGGIAPEELLYLLDAPTMRGGLFDMLDRIRGDHPGVRLIIVDTYVKVCDGALSKQENAYRADYREAGALKRYADQNGLAILAIHHNNKKGSSDAVSRISGTNGLAGAADTIWSLYHKRRSDPNATLGVTGRDVEAVDYAVRFNSGELRWNLLGNSADIEALDELQQYERNSIVRTILALVGQGGLWEGTMTELAEEIKAREGEALSEITLGRAIRTLSPALLRYDQIVREEARRSDQRVTKLYRSEL